LLAEGERGRLGGKFARWWIFGYAGGIDAVGRAGSDMVEPGEAGGVGVFAGRGGVAGAVGRPTFAGVEKRGGAGRIVGDAGFDVVIGGGAEGLHEAAGVEVGAVAARGLGHLRQPGAQCGEGVRAFDAAQDGRARAGAHGREAGGLVS
jgi:hypothetical protein